VGRARAAFRQLGPSDAPVELRWCDDVSVAKERWSGAVRSSSLKLLAIGLGIVAAYFLLAAVSNIGDPTDIGGGLILLVGYIVTAGGLLLVGKDLRAHWSRRRRM
jgi:hypothetical protein